MKKRYSITVSPTNALHLSWFSGMNIEQVKRLAPHCLRCLAQLRVGLTFPGLKPPNLKPRRCADEIALEDFWHSCAPHPSPPNPGVGIQTHICCTDRTNTSQKGSGILLLPPAALVTPFHGQRSFVAGSQTGRPAKPSVPPWRKHTNKRL